MGTDTRLIEGWNGKDYERHSSHQRQWGTGLIAELRLRGDERILDLGCGDGSLTRRLAERVPRGYVLGVDAAMEMLEAAQAKCGPTMAVHRLDLHDLDFNGEFDLVFSNATPHWIHDHAACSPTSTGPCDWAESCGRSSVAPGTVRTSPPACDA